MFLNIVDLFSRLKNVKYEAFFPGYNLTINNKYFSLLGRLS